MSEAPSHPPVPRGWYVDPANDAYLRFWDGSSWGDDRTPNPNLMAPATRANGSMPPATLPASPQPAAQTPAVRTNDSMLHPVYQQTFARFDQDGNKASWSWPGFLFGPLWYFSKGIWAKALGIFAVAFLSAGVLAIPIWFYTAIMGRYDYYLVHRYDNQGW